MLLPPSWHVNNLSVPQFYLLRNGDNTRLTQAVVGRNEVIHLDGIFAINVSYYC